MTSLIDVIFLLLLFFMLTSTFSRFGEIELSAAGGGTATVQTRPVFLSLGADRLTLNGEDRDIGELGGALQGLVAGAGDLPVIVALGASVTAQRLTDLLVTLRSVPGITVTVLDPQ